MTAAHTRPDANWLIYGAYGYTGSLIAEAASKRGHRPRLAGRNRGAVEKVAARLSLEPFPCDLEDSEGLRRAISGTKLVLHCAGPFIRTSRPMLDACLAEGAHYLDITGEIDVFEACHARSPEAVARGICLAPGVGFDVVPTDCVAAMLKEELKDATSLVLGFEASGGPSVGTAKTSLMGLAKGGRVRVAGAMVEVPLAFKTRTFMRGEKARLAMTIPWGDVFTAHVTTGIPDIEVYMVSSPKSIAWARRLNRVRPFLRFPLIAGFLQRRLDATVKSPTPEKRATTNCHIWGEAKAADGRIARMELETPNGYDLTVTASLGVVEHFLNTTSSSIRPGYLTPSQLVGPTYVLGLPGVTQKVRT